MGAQLRVYRRRIRSVQSTKKITRAMELIATSRIAKAQQRVTASRPYADAIREVIAATTSQSGVDHPLVTPRDQVRRAAIVVVTSDRGLAGAYSSSALKAADQLIARLGARGLEVSTYVIGRKGVGYYRFRERPMAATFTGFSEQPSYADAQQVSEPLLSAFVAGGTAPDGVDEIHIVSTAFLSMLSQRPEAVQILPLVNEAPAEGATESAPAAPAATGPVSLYEFEPSPEGVLDALLPRYVTATIYARLLESAAAESASRRRAMKSATDNAQDLIESYTRAANAARQAEITQEISEIVGGADALAGA